MPMLLARLRRLRPVCAWKELLACYAASPTIRGGDEDNEEVQTLAESYFPWAHGDQNPTLRKLTRRDVLISTIPGSSVAALGIPWVSAAEWHKQLATPNFGVLSSENDTDRIARYKAFVAYLGRRLQLPIKMHQATDYAGTIEAFKARKLAFADPNSTSAFAAPSYFLRE
jgi:ABC transporter, phosphonate, periplasmic substrate-binding protein